MNPPRTTFLFACLLLLAAVSLASAQKTSTGSFDRVLPVNRRYAPVLDSSINVAKLSLADRNKLIEKLFEVDQLYRKPTSNTCWAPDSKEARYHNNLMALNDPVNQALLLKILRLDGWPCDLSKGAKALSYKAWFIVWHNRGSYEGMNRFYPYLAKAKASNCISTSQFNEVNNVLTQERAFRKGFSTTR